MTRNDSVNGPGYWNLDAVAREADAVRRPGRGRAAGGRIQRVNHPHFDNPNGTFGNATFGQVTGMAGAYSPRLVRFGARVIF